MTDCVMFIVNEKVTANRVFHLFANAVDYFLSDPYDPDVLLGMPKEIIFLDTDNNPENIYTLVEATSHPLTFLQKRMFQDVASVESKYTPSIVIAAAPIPESILNDIRLTFPNAKIMGVL